MTFFIICGLFGFPMLLFAVFFLWQSPKPSKRPTPAQIIESVENTQSVEEISKAYAMFYDYYGRIPVDQEEGKEWFEYFTKLISLSVASVEMVLDLSDRIQKINQERQREVVDLTANILRTKKR
ncbi:hypothetical protein [Helicobacter mustelae]|uniref:hypothetical protein n=1 Tax=Helicobacter mustelae TaxID=217 RepID=UPI0014727EED|nr:hypothetical protein [Helicobacter mustelae]